MHVTTKGQVTIPKSVRQRLGIRPNMNVEFKEDRGRFYLTRADETEPTTSFHELRGTATVRMRTDEIMQLTRGED